MVIYLVFLERLRFHKQPSTHAWHSGIPIRGLHTLRWALCLHRLYLCSAELQAVLHLVPYFPATLSVTASLLHCFSWKVEVVELWRWRWWRWWWGRCLPAARAWWFIVAGWSAVAPYYSNFVAWTGAGFCLCLCRFPRLLLPRTFNTHERES